MANDKIQLGCTLQHSGNQTLDVVRFVREWFTQCRGCGNFTGPYTTKQEAIDAFNQGWRASI